MENNLSFEVNINKTFLSSESRIYKTEKFFYMTKKLAGLNSFILKIAETLQSQISKIKQMFLRTKNPINIQTIDGKFSFDVVLGYQINYKAYGLNENDIIFVSAEKFDGLKQNDQRINFYLRNSKIFNIILGESEIEFEEEDLKKLYLISSSEFVNFPLLSFEQQRLVEIEDKNVLIQGVAGSGKTNVCYSKLIYTACKNYSGKVLYTTFSRGLLIDTKTKIEFYKNSIKNLIDDYKTGRIVFLDKNHKKAIENRLGIYLVADSEQNIIKKLNQIVDFLEGHIDYKLIEDIHLDYFEDKPIISNEETFTNEFLKSLNNHQLKARLEKIKDLSYSIIYKEIYGMIFGGFGDNESEMLGREEYKLKRQNSFTPVECDVIYDIAIWYDKFQKTQNLTDNNKIARKILKNKQKLNKYSLVIADEVQDFTQVNLWLLKNLSIKMFCVGDALQMVNPSYFSFAYLKNLMYNEDVTDVVELESNYRNNKKIVEILDELSKINITEFGTHSFVLSSKSVDENSSANTIYTFGSEFLNKLSKEKFEDFTLLVADEKDKQKLRQTFKKQEILTIAEIKGLERETVVLVNILSSNISKWQRLENLKINHKQADENSVYRYYFNLFYVGLSRAKHNLFVVEENKISAFNSFFKDNFEILNADDAMDKFGEVVSKLEIDEDEIYERIDEFIKLGQFENAKFYAKKLGGYEEVQQIEKIDAFKNYVFKGLNKQAGIKLWKVGLLEEAKKQFLISGDIKLIEFLNSLETKSKSNLDGDIVRFWNDFEDNEDARSLIIETLLQELGQIKEVHESTKQKLNKFKEKR